MRQLSVRMKYWGCLLLFIIYGTFNAFGNGTPEVRIIYLIPSDKEFRQDYKDAIENAIKDVQIWYHNQMGNGKTFRLHIPIVEVFHTAHPASWYSTHPTGEYKDWFWDNVFEDGFKLTGGEFNDPNNIWIFYIDADPACRQLGGAGGGGVALLPANDLRGLVGEQNIPACPDESPDNAGVGRWIGGLAHELGHALGLPHPPECEDKDPSNDDNKCHSLMYHGYRDYPNTFLLPEDRQKLNQSPFFLPITSPSPPSIRGEKTIEEALDLNQNHLIDDNEILQAISYWIAGELVPGTDGKIIDDAKILELMDMWIKGTPRPLSLSEAKVKGTNLAVEVSPKLVRNFSIVRFKVEGTGIAETRIQIFTLAGHLVYDSYFIPGNAFEWRPQTKEGQPLANGVYLYVVRVRGFDGREYVSEVRKLVILR